MIESDFQIRENFFLNLEEADIRWEQLSGHEAAFSSNPMANVFTYDPADDGPECETITRVLAHHPLYKAGAERHFLRASVNVNTAARILFQREYAQLSDPEKARAHGETARALANLFKKNLM